MTKRKQHYELPAEIDQLTGEPETTAIYTARHFNFGADPCQSSTHMQRRVLSLAANIQERKERQFVFSAVLVSLLPAELRPAASIEFDRIFVRRQKK